MRMGKKTLAVTLAVSMLAGMGGIHTFAEDQVPEMPENSVEELDAESAPASASEGAQTEAETKAPETEPETKAPETEAPATEPATEAETKAPETEPATEAVTEAPQTEAPAETETEPATEAPAETQPTEPETQADATGEDPEQPEETETEGETETEAVTESESESETEAATENESEVPEEPSSVAAVVSGIDENSREGAQMTLTCSVEGCENGYTVQWQSRKLDWFGNVVPGAVWTDIPGATSDVYTVSITEETALLQWRAVVTGTAAPTAGEE